MKRITLTTLILAISLSIIGTVFPGMSKAEEPLKYSCSHQAFNAFEREKIELFTQTTGIKVDVFASSSGSATFRLINGYSDVASAARSLYKRYQSYGYMQTPICKDPMAVIAKTACGVENLSLKQLQSIFSGDIKNWKEVGGADLPVLVIVPDKDTAANKNFRRQVMKHNDINFDFMAYDSTMVIEAVKHFPCGAVSFISQGAVTHYPSIKAIRIDGAAPTDAAYPYYQIFYYVTKGKPAGIVKQFIDFAFSDGSAKIIRKNGMLPFSR